MAETGRFFTFEAEAAADLSDHQYNIMRWTGSETVNVASHDQADPTVGAIGILDNKPDAAGQSATIVYLGEYKVRCGASLNDGDWFTTNGSGRAVAAASGELVVGRMLEAAAADGDVKRCLVVPTFILATA